MFYLSLQTMPALHESRRLVSLLPPCPRARQETFYEKSVAKVTI